MKLDFWRRPPWRRYVTQVRDALDKWAVWMPGSDVSPGDFGVISNKRFLRVGSIFEFRAEPPNIKVSSLKLDLLEFGHLSRSTARANAEVGLLAPLAASAHLDLSNSNGVFLRALGLSERQINSGDMRQGIAQTLEELDWQEDWVVAQAVTSAKNFSLILAAKPASKISVAGSGDILEKLNLGTIKADAILEIQGDVKVQIVGRSGALFVDLARADVPRQRVHGLAPNSILDRIELTPHRPQSIPWSDASAEEP